MIKQARFSAGKLYLNGQVGLGRTVVAKDPDDRLRYQKVTMIKSF